VGKITHHWTGVWKKGKKGEKGRPKTKNRKPTTKKAHWGRRKNTKKKGAKKKQKKKMKEGSWDCGATVEKNAENKQKKKKNMYKWEERETKMRAGGQ